MGGILGMDFIGGILVITGQVYSVYPTCSPLKSYMMFLSNHPKCRPFSKV
jgi:hypothetical protein